MGLPRAVMHDTETWSRVRNSAIAEARRVSMLHEDALALLHKLAGICGGPVVEIGPYIGGSTIALASAASKVVTVEIGGPNPGHDLLPTNDIIGDLQMNLERAGVLDRVAIIEGRFSDRHVMRQVQDELAGVSAGLIFIDTDPGSELALASYLQFTRDDAYVAVDDYRSDIARAKSEILSRFIDECVRAGALEEFGVYGWGTWFGKLVPVKCQAILSLPIPLLCYHEIGYCWLVHVGHADAADNQTNNASTIRLFENDQPLGPAHSLHVDVREKGLGHYSHWGEYLYFSTSDNSDPRLNARRYWYRIDSNEFALNSPICL
jgi:predicted O-methyltransferase YrrM